MVTITLYARQKKRHRCIEQTFGPCGRRRGWDDLREQHWNMYIIKCETDDQSRLDAWDKCSGLVHWDDPGGWGGEGGSGWGTHVKVWVLNWVRFYCWVLEDRTDWKTGRLLWDGTIKGDVSQFGEIAFILRARGRQPTCFLSFFSLFLFEYLLKVIVK